MNAKGSALIYHCIQESKFLVGQNAYNFIALELDGRLSGNFLLNKPANQLRVCPEVTCRIALRESVTRSDSSESRTREEREVIAGR